MSSITWLGDQVLGGVVGVVVWWVVVVVGVGTGLVVGLALKAQPGEQLLGTEHRGVLRTACTVGWYRVGGGVPGGGYRVQGGGYRVPGLGCPGSGLQWENSGKCVPGLPEPSPGTGLVGLKAWPVPPRPRLAVFKAPVMKSASGSESGRFSRNGSKKWSFCRKVTNSRENTEKSVIPSRYGNRCRKG